MLFVKQKTTETKKRISFLINKIDVLQAESKRLEEENRVLQNIMLKIKKELNCLKKIATESDNKKQ